jgi:hypothetical protein
MQKIGKVTFYLEKERCNDIDVKCNFSAMRQPSQILYSALGMAKLR